MSNQDKNASNETKKIKFMIELSLNLDRPQDSFKLVPEYLKLN
jgi:hypothetical protein